MEIASVALGGDSLVLAGIARRLAMDDRFDVVTTDVEDPDIVARLEAASAHVLIVDLPTVSSVRRKSTISSTVAV